MIAASYTHAECPFYIIASEVKHEKTFVIKKLSVQHTRLPDSENTKVTTHRVAKECENVIRTDPGLRLT